LEKAFGEHNAEVDFQAFSVPEQLVWKAVDILLFYIQRLTRIFR